MHWPVAPAESVVIDFPWEEPAGAVAVAVVVTAAGEAGAERFVIRLKIEGLAGTEAVLAVAVVVGAGAGAAPLQTALLALPALVQS